MHKVQQRQSRVSIYPNYEGDDIDLGGDDDGDVAIDDEDGTSPHTKGVPVAMTMSNSPWRRSQSSRINPLLEKKKRTIASAVISENYVKIRA
jgi:hypothetical protein